jgi:hypothetical protein
MEKSLNKQKNPFRILLIQSLYGGLLFLHISCDNQRLTGQVRNIGFRGWPN